MKKSIITKIITAAIVTTLAIGGATVLAAPAGTISIGETRNVEIGKTNDTISHEFTFIPEHDGVYHFESDSIEMTGGYGIIDPMVRIFVGDQVTPDNQIASIDGGVDGTLDFSGDVTLKGGQVYTLKVSSHFNPSLRPTGRFNLTITDVTPVTNPIIDADPTDEPEVPGDETPADDTPDTDEIPDTNEPSEETETPDERILPDEPIEVEEYPGQFDENGEEEIIIIIIHVEEEPVTDAPCY